MEKSTPKISIALATYNGAQYLPALLDSLCNQNIHPDEIIAVDDCSTDSTIDILRTYSSKLPIKIFQNSFNLGVNKNFEKAVKNCSGEYILICDQDDVWFPNNIEEKINLLKKMPPNEPNLVTSGSILSDKNLVPIRDLKIRKDISDWKILITKCFQGTTMAFNRILRNNLTQWPSSFRDVPYDYYIYCNALLTGNIYASSLSLMYYRSHDKNVSFKSGKLKNTIKSIFPTHLFFTDTLTVHALEEFSYALKSIPIQSMHEERYQSSIQLLECKSQNHILWTKFFKLNFVPFALKIKTFIGSMLLSLKG